MSMMYGHFEELNSDATMRHDSPRQNHAYLQSEKGWFTLISLISLMYIYIYILIDIIDIPYVYRLQNCRSECHSWIPGRGCPLRIAFTGVRVTDWRSEPLDHGREPSRPLICESCPHYLTISKKYMDGDYRKLLRTVYFLVISHSYVTIPHV